MPAPGEAAAEDGPFTGKADSYVPTFSGKQSDYKEFRRRCDIYAAKMKLAKRDQETVFNIVTLLKGQAWDCLEDLGIDDLAKETAYKTVFDRLDKSFKFDPLTELPADFEAYFIKLQRRPGQTVQQYQTEYMHVERRLTSVHQLDLPEKVRAWWFLRRSGLTKDQRQLVLTQLGENNLTLDKVMKAMNFIIGQDSKMESSSSSRWTKEKTTYKATYLAEDDDVDDGSQAWDDDAYYGDETHIDDQEDYYFDPNEQVDEPYVDGIYDVEEYDNIFASYVEAKNQLNKLRTSRGFYPVVAMVQGPMNENKGKTSGKGKQSGKNKGKNFGKSPQQPQRKGIQNRGQAALGLGKSLCLRCGQAGHRARDCPAGTDSKKRKNETDDADVHMVNNDIDMADTELNVPHSSPNDRAVQDGGAASVLGSAKSIIDYIEFMQNYGIDVDNEVDVYACEKGFRYGNSQREVTNLCCLLPTFIGGEKQKILCYVIQGEAPILIGRPLMKKLNMVIDYAADLYLTGNNVWRPLDLGPKGEHIIHLMEDYENLKESNMEPKILMPEDFADHIDVYNRLPWSCLKDASVMEVQEYPAAQRDESLDKQSVHESLADAVVSQSAHEAEQSMHEALSSVPPMIPEGEESTEKTRDPTVSLSSCTPNSTESNSKDVARLHPNRLRKMIYEAQYLVREHKKMLNEAKKPSQKTHVVWELLRQRATV